jgi:hypothetical protein
MAIAVAAYIASARRYCRALGWPDVEFGWRLQDSCGASLFVAAGQFRFLQWSVQFEEAAMFEAFAKWEL